MSDNIRDFRNSGQESNEAEKSNTGFYALVLAIPVIAIIAGLGYKPMMEMRGKSVASIQQAEADLDAKRRAENPLYAIMNAPKNEDGLIDLNASIGFGTPPSPEAAARRKARNDYSRRALNAKEYLGRVDAKVSGLNPLEMEILKYKRANWAMSKCGYEDLRKFYKAQNKSAYETLKAKQDIARDARRSVQQAQMGKLEIPQIENKTQALAFVASGGVARHQQNSMAMMAGLDGMLADSGNYKVANRKQGFNQKGCMQVRTIIQSGAMKIKTNVRLK